MALRNLNIPHEVVATAEIDKYAVISYAAIHCDVEHILNKEMINMKSFQELDEWAFDIEQDFKAGKKVNKIKYLKICTLRDKLYKKYLKELEENYNNFFWRKPMPKSCVKRQISTKTNKN